MTATASSGAIESPFTDEDATKIARRTLVETYIYNMDPSKFKSKGREDLGNLAKFQSTNIKGNSPYAKINLGQSDDNRIEAHQNGMLDLEFDAISEKAKQQNTDAVKKGDAEVGNGIPSKVGGQLLSDAKARTKRLDHKIKGQVIQHGGDIEIVPGSEAKKPKKITENMNIKKYKFKDILLREEEVLEAVGKLPKSALQEGSTFFVEDSASNRYKITMECGTAFIENKENLNENKKIEGAFQKLVGYKPIGDKTSINENDVFKKMLREVKPNE